MEPVVQARPGDFIKTSNESEIMSHDAGEVGTAKQRSVAGV